jgi:hydroxyacylglutathione hydrolase
VFTGGSLIVGAAARTDLVSPERTEELTRAQWRSLQRLVTLPDEVQVWPTHGAGSFCSAPPGAERSSTIGQEKASNALLRAGSEDAFVAALLGGLGSYPAYFRRLGEVNRRGARPVDRTPTLSGQTPQQLTAAVDGGALVVDVRPVAAFAAGHIDGAVSIPLRDVFATWLGWTTDPQTPLVFVRDADQDPDEIVWQALKIGYANFVGELAGGMAAWEAAGLPMRRTALLDADQLEARVVVDVRQRSEFTGGHLPDAANVELGALAEGAPADVGPGMAVMCGHGERAMTAASLLERTGHEDVAVVVGGPDDWAQATGRELTRS